MSRQYISIQKNNKTIAVIEFVAEIDVTFESRLLGAFSNQALLSTCSTPGSELECMVSKSIYSQ